MWKQLEKLHGWSKMKNLDKHYLDILRHVHETPAFQVVPRGAECLYDGKGPEMMGYSWPPVNDLVDWGYLKQVDGDTVATEAGLKAMEK